MMSTPAHTIRQSLIHVARTRIPHSISQSFRDRAGKPGCCALSRNESRNRCGIATARSCRQESPAYKGHSLNMLRQGGAHALNAEVKVVFEPEHGKRSAAVAEPKVKYVR